MKPLHKAFLSIAAIALTFAAFLLPRTQEVSVRADGGSEVMPVAPTERRIDGGGESALRAVTGAQNGSASTTGPAVTAIVWPDLDVFARLGAEETMSAISAELERVSLFVNSSEAQNRAQVPAAVTPAELRPGVSRSEVGGGGLTRDQLQALARCESGLDPYAGDPSPWRTGYFGLEAGHPVGGLSLAEQEAEVQRIYATHGASAWGCPI